MASMIDAVNETFSEDKAALKFILFALPVYYCAQFFIDGNMGMCYFLSAITGIILLGLITQVINNIRRGKMEIISLNPLQLLWSIALMSVAIIPQIVIFCYISILAIKYITMPAEIPHADLIFKIIVWILSGSIILTSYLSFAKYLNIKQAYNYKVILESFPDIIVNVIFLIPQLVIMDAILIGPAIYLCKCLNIEYTNWFFVFYYSLVFIINIVVFANYFAQAAYENIKGNNQDYDYNVVITSLEEVDDKMK